MIAAQANKPANSIQLDEPVQHTLRIRSAVDVIAKEDEPIFGCRPHEPEQGVERGETAVDVANRERASHGNRLKATTDHTDDTDKKTLIRVIRVIRGKV